MKNIIYFKGISKLATAIYSPGLFHILNQEFEKVYLTYEKRDQKYRYVLEKSVKRLEFIYKIGKILYVFCVSFFYLSAVSYILFTSKRAYIMQFLIPGIDSATDQGYIIIFLIHSVCLFFGAFGNFAGDMFILNVISQVPLYADIFKLKFEELNDILQNHKNEFGVKKILVDIVNWHQNYYKYFKN